MSKITRKKKFKREKKKENIINRLYLPFLNYKFGGTEDLYQVLNYSNECAIAHRSSGNFYIANEYANISYALDNGYLSYQDFMLNNDVCKLYNGFHNDFFKC